MYSNVDSLLNKRDLLKLRIELEKPDIILISEVLPKRCITPIQESELQLDGYDLHSNLSMETCKRGVLIYTKVSLRASPSQIEELCKFEESCWCEVKLAEKDSLLIGCVYRSPNSNGENNDHLNKCLKDVCNSSKFTHLLMCGDTNFPEINWVDGISPIDPLHKASLFMETVRDCFLYQKVTAPTHQRKGQQANTLDLVFTNEDGMVGEVEHTAPIGKSHHDTLIFKFCGYKDIPKLSQKKFKFDQGDYDQIRQNLVTINWENMFQGKSLDEQWLLFKHII